MKLVTDESRIVKAIENLNSQFWIIRSQKHTQNNIGKALDMICIDFFKVLRCFYFLSESFEIFLRY